MDPIDRATTFLATQPGVDAAYLFGSMNEGRAHRESDLDLAVLLDWTRFPHRRDRADAQLDLLGGLIAAVASNAVDLVVLNDAPPLLGRHIIRRGRRILVNTPAAAHAYERDVQLRAADVEPFVMRGRRRILDALRP